MCKIDESQMVRDLQISVRALHGLHVSLGFNIPIDACSYNEIFESKNVRTLTELLRLLHTNVSESWIDL